jgi:hypothetical protein
MEGHAMCHDERTVAELLDTCITCGKQLIAKVSEQMKAGTHSGEGLQCLQDSLNSLNRCKTYFKRGEDAATGSMSFTASFRLEDPETETGHSPDGFSGSR